MAKKIHNTSTDCDEAKSNSCATDIPIMSKKELKKKRKQQKKLVRGRAAEYLFEKYGAAGNTKADRGVHVPAYVKSFKRKYTFAEIADIAGLTPQHHYFALDCEFVQTAEGQCLGSISIVNSDCQLVFHSYSLPQTAVVDYLTRWSGLDQRHLESAPPFQLVRRRVLSFIEGKMIIGHAVWNDFKVLEIAHPKHLTLDTMGISWLKDLAKQAGEHGKSLKKLSLSLLDRKIQEKEHNSTEDAQCTMALFQLVQSTWLDYVAFKHAHFERKLLDADDWNEIEHV